MSENIKFLSDFIFSNFQRTHGRIDIYRFPNRYLLTLFILVWFTIQKRRGKIQTGEKKCLPRFVKSFCLWLDFATQNITFTLRPAVWMLWKNFPSLTLKEILLVFWLFYCLNGNVSNKKNYTKILKRRCSLEPSPAERRFKVPSHYVNIDNPRPTFQECVSSQLEWVIFLGVGKFFSFFRW